MYVLITPHDDRVPPHDEVIHLTISSATSPLPHDEVPLLHDELVPPHDRVPLPHDKQYTIDNFDTNPPPHHNN